MTGKLRVMKASYKNITISPADARKFRGFFADLDEGDANLHNHRPTGELVYQYPRVQYKVIHGHPTVVAAEEGIRSIHPHLMEQTSLKIGKTTYTDVALDIRLSEALVGDSRRVRQYCFQTPWLALNQDNYGKYRGMDSEAQEILLNRILIGNVLSMCKGFGVTVEQPLQAYHQLKETPVLYKGQKMTGFIGTFRMNCCIPDGFGLGKGTARGFGTVKIIQEKGE